VSIFIPELLQRSTGEEVGVATVMLVQTLAPTKIFVNDPPPCHLHPKLTPKSTASSGGDTLAHSVGELGDVVDGVCSQGIKGE